MPPKLFLPPFNHNCMDKFYDIREGVNSVRCWVDTASLQYVVWRTSINSLTVDFVALCQRRFRNVYVRMQRVQSL